MSGQITIAIKMISKINLGNFMIRKFQHQNTVSIQSDVAYAFSWRELITLRAVMYVERRVISLNDKCVRAVNNKASFIDSLDSISYVIVTCHKSNMLPIHMLV